MESRSSGTRDRDHPLPKVVARIHHVGCSARRLRAAKSASRAVANSPKQVAPEPDMRAN